MKQALVCCVAAQQSCNSCNTAGTCVPSCVCFRVYYAYSAAAMGVDVGVGVELFERQG
jgi:hypothetical protein